MLNNAGPAFDGSLAEADGFGFGCWLAARLGWRAALNRHGALLDRMNEFVAEQGALWFPSRRKMDIAAESDRRGPVLLCDSIARMHADTTEIGP